MKILIICRLHKDRMASFVEEQVTALQKKGVDVEYFLISHGGISGYAKAFLELEKKIKEFQPDLIHSHYGFSGLLANLQRKLPVITTYHGSDINKTPARIVSFFAVLFSDFNIFVSEKLHRKVSFLKRSKYATIPCGVDTGLFHPLPKIDAQKTMNLDFNKKYILFSNAFSMPVKNYKLAVEATGCLNEKVELVELKGYERQKVSLLLNACDVALMTSFSEGSPQFIKEAMACNCPIVSTDVGDVKDIIDGVDGCYFTSFEPADVADKIRKALNFSETKGRTNGRERIISLGLDSRTIAGRIVEVYRAVLNRKEFHAK